MERNIITEIIELDRQADIKIENARKKSEEIIESAKKEAIDIYNQSVERSKQYSEKVEAVEKKAAELRIDELTKKKDKKISEYDALYNEKHTEWADEIFDRIVNHPVAF